MSDRYTVIFSLRPNGHIYGVPLLICGGNLLWDGYNGRPCAQIKMQSLSAKVIRSVTTRIVLMNNRGDVVESQVFVYDKLDVSRDQFFGDQSVIPSNDTSGTSFSVSIIETVLYDGTILIPDSDVVQLIPENRPLVDVLEDDKELECQFQLENGKIHRYAPYSIGDIWGCSCGAINNLEENVCHRCKTRYDTVNNLDIEGLKKRKDIRLKKRQEKRSRIKNRIKKKVTFGTIVLVAAFAIGACFRFLIIPAVRYKQAVKSFSTGDYKTAISLFKQSGDYKDSAEKTIDARKMYCMKEYNRILSKGDGSDIGTDLAVDDVADSETQFGLAYIDNDNVPELIVSTHGYRCYIFTLVEKNDYEEEIEKINSSLYYDTNNRTELGYFEKNGYVYSKINEAGKDGADTERWITLDDKNPDKTIFFESTVERYDDSDDYVYYTITRNGYTDVYSSKDFYGSLEKHIDLKTYKKFEMISNSDSNRQEKLGISDEK